MLCEELDICDHYKYLDEVFGISDELCGYAGFDTYEAATAEAAAAKERHEAHIKSEKNRRKESIDRTMLSVIEMVAQIFKIHSDEMVDSITDMESKTEALHNFFQKDGSEALIFSYSPNRTDENRIGILKEKEIQTEQCAIIYRTDNTTEITPKNLPNILNISDIKPDDNWSTTLLLARIFREIWLPTFIHFGQDNTDTLMVLKANELFLENCDSITKNPIVLTMDGDFYEANLSSTDKIQKTSVNRELVQIVEEISIEWMRIVEKILIKGKVTRRAPPNTGPIDELEYWLQMHSMYSIAQEQMSMEQFQNHLECLKISGSKLVQKWKDVANKLEIANSEASENVQFLNSLERFQFPLYGHIENIKENVDPLFVALRTVYKTSSFYNSPNSMASFLSKCTNHLTLCCRSYIMTGSPSNLFQQPHVQLMEKISICLELLRTYRHIFDETLKQMRMAGEPEWNFSEKYVFGQTNQLVDRLSKLQKIIETDEKYSVLENILMENIQDFYEPINKAYNQIANKSYDHLDFREEQFEDDFAVWHQTMERLENKMHTHVEADINQFPSSPLIALSHLKRFEGLAFDCLTIPDRYIDIVNVFVNNINFMKDSFNLTKASHIVPNLMCKYSGCISWVRSIERKMNEVVDLVKSDDIFNDERRLIVQNTTKLYNALSKDLTLYEFQQYKAWFDNVHYVYDSLSQPVIRRNPSTNRLEVNFNINILNTLEEGKKMLKMHFDMPHLGEALVKYEDDLKRKLGSLTQLIVWNNALRLSIHVVFVNIFRPQLQKIDIAFRPGLSQIQWLSKDFDAYLENVDKVLNDVNCLVKRASDRKTFHIEDIILSMHELQPIVLFDEPTDINRLFEENEKHKKEMEQILVEKSTTAEKATVQLITLFIRHTDITSSDKYDFIAFENLFQQVFVYSEGDHIEPLFKDYAELQYGVEQLHSDCMDIFNYFMHQILDDMIRSTKKAYDMIRDYFFHKEEPAVLAVAKVDTSSCCYLSPNLDSISETFLHLIHNITGIFGCVNAWGEHAVIPESVKYEFDVNTLREGFLKNVDGNREIQRAKTQFDSGLSLLRPEVDALLTDIYAKYCHLWADDNAIGIDEFINTNPIPTAIEDEFSRYQLILDELETASKIAQVDCIAVDKSEVFQIFTDYARKWKSKLAERLAIIYKEKFDEVNDFIGETQTVLRRELKDEEDFTAAIECLVNVYKHIERMETMVYQTTGTFNILVKFNESIGNVDKSEIDELNGRYAKMFADTKAVEVHIRNNFDEIMSKI